MQRDQYLTADSQELSAIDLLLALAKHKKLVLGLPFAAALITALIVFLIPPKFTATARILPPQQGQSAMLALLGQASGMGAVLPSAMGIKNPADLYVGMLQSRTIADRLIERFDLRALFDQNTLVDTRERLANITNISAGRDGIIVIEVDDKDPKRASEMANAYVAELSALTDRLAVTEASQRRLFFERQLVQAKSDLADSEVALQKTQETTGLIKLDDQGRAIIENVARLRAQIAAREVQLAAMRTFATERNSDYRLLQEELVGLRAQLNKLEQQNGTGAKGDVLMPTGRIPAAGLEYVRKLRDVKYNETMFELLAKQFELAKIEEAKEGAVLQVVDYAVATDKKSKPRRTLIVAASLLAFFILAIILALLLEGFAKLRGSPEQSAKVDALRNSLRWRSKP